MKLGRLYLASLFSVLFLPYLFLIYQFPKLNISDPGELWWAFKNTFLQSSISAILILLLGTGGVFALYQAAEWDLHFKKPFIKRTMTLLMLLPSFVPSLFLLLAILQLVEPFPVGLLGISFVHLIMYWGFASALLSESISKNSGSMIEVASLLGASRFKILREIIFPRHRSELLSLFIYFFSVCFISFSVPLVVGGGKGTTIEVLIYEKIRISGDWGPAVALSLLQSIVLIALAQIQLSKTQIFSSTRISKTNFLGSKLMFVLFFCLCVFPVLGFSKAVLEGLAQVSRLFETENDFVSQIFSSLWMGVSSGLMIFLMLLGSLFCFRESKQLRWLRSLVPASTALVGFCLLFLGPNESFHPYWKIPLGLSFLSFPFFLKMGWLELLDSKAKQIQVAESLGATDRMITIQILIPQMLDRASTLSAYMGLWAVGDFALSKILAHRNLSIAMEVESLMSSYRISLAAVLACLLIPVSILVYFLLRSLKHVQRSES